MTIRLRFSTLLSILLSCIPFGVYCSFYQEMPQLIPMHYDSVGQVDRWVDKANPEVFIICALGFYGLVIMKTVSFFIAKASSRDKEHNKKMTQNIMNVATVFVSALFASISIYYLFVATQSISFDSQFVIRLGFVTLGLSLSITGNFLPKLEQNKVSGVRTRKTLSDKRVWFKAQRFTSKVWVVGGMLLVIVTLIPGDLFWIFSLVLFLLIILIPMMYLRKYSSQNKMSS